MQPGASGATEEGEKRERKKKKMTIKETRLMFGRYCTTSFFLSLSLSCLALNALPSVIMHKYSRDTRIICVERRTSVFI